MKIAKKLTALALVLVMLATIPAALPEAQAAQRVVVGHSNGEVTRTLVDASLSIAGLTREGTTAFTVTFAPGTTSIGWGAFADVMGVTRITLPSGATSIGGEAFLNAVQLRRVDIPDTVTFIALDALHFRPGADGERRPLPVTVHGRTGSQAQIFAMQNGLTFRVLQNPRVSRPGAINRRSPARARRNINRNARINLRVNLPRRPSQTRWQFQWQRRVGNGRWTNIRRATRQSYRTPASHANAQRRNRYRLRARLRCTRTGDNQRRNSNWRNSQVFDIRVR